MSPEFSPRWFVRFVACFVAVMMLSAVFVVAFSADEPADDEWRLRMGVKPLPEDVRRVFLEADGAGEHWFVLQKLDGSEEKLKPEGFAALLEHDHRDKSFLYRLLNITSPIGFAWVALGLLGQVLFTGRMLLQWITSERQKRSVVPVGFWWMSLAGASMLLVYFIWRRDIVGVLGQSAGWVIYLRNLWLIHRPGTPSRLQAANGQDVHTSSSVFLPENATAGRPLTGTQGSDHGENTAGDDSRKNHATE